MSSKLLTHLSQSFFIDKPCFVTKVDLFFSSKDENIPFKLNLRRNKQGMPTNDILNFSQVVVPAADVQAPPTIDSSNANVATTVTFESPVYLEVGEYSLNLGSDSRSYNVFVATLNDTDLTTDRKITQQPLIGSFFQTENLSTFIPSTFDDLKFNLYRAKFDTTVTSTVDIVPAYLEDAVSGIDGTLDSDPFELFVGRTTMKVYQPNHGYAQGSFVKFNGVANTMSNIRSISGTASGIGHDSGMDAGKIFNLDGNVYNVVFEVSNVKLNSYTVDLGSGNIPTVTEPRVRFGGETVTIAKNRNFTTLTPTLSVYKTGNTTLNHKVKTTTVGSTYTKDTNFSIVRNLSPNSFDNEKGLLSQINLANKLANVVSFEYLLEMNTSNDRVTPMVDTKQMGMILRRDLVDNTNYTATVLEHELTSLANTIGPHKANIYRSANGIGIINLSNVMDMNNANAVINGSILNVQANTSATSGSGANNSGLYRVIDVFASTSDNVHIKVAKITGDIDTDIANNNVYSIVHSNDYITEEAATGGTNYSKYITREVSFNNPSTGIRFLVDASVPLNSNLDFYFKTKIAGDNTNLKDIEYKKVSGVVIPNSLEGEFVEVNHQIDNIDAFNSVVFKIVFNAANTANAPKIKNFRLIAVS